MKWTRYLNIYSISFVASNKRIKNAKYYNNNITIEVDNQRCSCPHNLFCHKCDFSVILDFSSLLGSICLHPRDMYTNIVITTPVKNIVSVLTIHVSNVHVHLVCHTYWWKSYASKIEAPLPRICQFRCGIVKIGEDSTGKDGYSRLKTGKHGKHLQYVERDRDAESRFYY